MIPHYSIWKWVLQLFRNGNWIWEFFVLVILWCFHRILLELLQSYLIVLPLKVETFCLLMFLFLKINLSFTLEGTLFYPFSCCFYIMRCKHNQSCLVVFFCKCFTVHLNWHISVYLVTQIWKGSWKQLMTCLKTV